MPVPLRASDVLSLGTFGAICAVLQQRMKQPGMYMAVVAICPQAMAIFIDGLRAIAEALGIHFANRTEILRSSGGSEQ